MHELLIRLDRESYQREAVIAAAHRYSDAFDIALGSEDSDWTISLQSDEPLPEGLVGRIKRDALDEMLRIQVKAQTQAIHEALVAAAVAGALRQS